MEEHRQKTKEAYSVSGGAKHMNQKRADFEAWRMMGSLFYKDDQGYLRRHLLIDIESS